MMIKKTKAQSFLEFALILPILLILLIGVVEMTLFIGRYISLVDLTREAARFASNRDPFKSGTKTNCSVENDYNFWFDTSCVFSPLRGDPSCVVDPTILPPIDPHPFCNGFNGAVPIKFDEDDILISVFTESMLPPPGNPTGAKVPTIKQNDSRLMATNPWVWSEHDYDTTHNSNWRRDCGRLTTPVTANPYFTPAKLESYLSTTAYADKGFVTVEVYYCYHHVIGVPIFSNFIPDPILIHTYTVMPLPALQPTAVPEP
jgi:hypothetical protein